VYTQRDDHCICQNTSRANLCLGESRERGVYDVCCGGWMRDKIKGIESAGKRKTR
jgi:hypothetical protein